MLSGLGAKWFIFWLRKELNCWQIRTAFPLIPLLLQRKKAVFTPPKTGKVWRLSVQTSPTKKPIIPLSVDVEAGYAQDRKGVVDNVLTLAKMGCSGVNLEDSIPNQGLQNKDGFAELIQEIKAELLNNGFDNFYLNIRTDTYLTMENPLEETISRAALYENAGADGIFIPCIQTDEDIKAVLEKINIPLNVMSLPNLTDIEKLKKLGVQRFSYGNAMSDCIISEIEKLTNKIVKDNNTSSLYNHDNVITKFK